MESLILQVKQHLIDDLGLEDITPEDIVDTAPLFVEGLGLDSLDAVEIVVMVEKRFGIRIASTEEGKEAFASVSTLAGFIKSRLAS